MNIKKNSTKLVIRAIADYPDIKQQPVLIKLKVDDTAHNLRIFKKKWINLEIPLAKSNADCAYLVWEVNRTWNPKKAGLSDRDCRELGITIEKIWTE